MGSIKTGNLGGRKVKRVKQIIIKEPIIIDK